AERDRLGRPLPASSGPRRDHPRRRRSAGDRPVEAEVETAAGRLGRGAGRARVADAGPRTEKLVVRDELEQSAVRDAEVEVPASPARARVALERPGHDRDLVPAQVLDCLFDRSRPDETEVAVAWLDRFGCVQPLESGSVDVQLPVAKAVVAEPGVLLVDLGTEHIA